MYVCMEYIPVVNSMSVLCLWNIQLTFDWDEIEPQTYTIVNMSDSAANLFRSF